LSKGVAEFRLEALEEAAHTPSGAVNGQTLIDWCNEVGVPIHNAARVSVNY